MRVLIDSYLRTRYLAVMVISRWSRQTTYKQNTRRRAEEQQGISNRKHRRGAENIARRSNAGGARVGEPNELGTRYLKNGHPQRSRKNHTTEQSPSPHHQRKKTKSSNESNAREAESRRQASISNGLRLRRNAERKFAPAWLDDGNGSSRSSQK